MGWNVYVHSYVANIAQCGESDCGWRGTPNASRQQAEDEVAAHWADHDARWEQYNDALELGLPLADAERIRLGDACLVDGKLFELPQDAAR